MFQFDMFRMEKMLNSLQISPNIFVSFIKNVLRIFPRKVVNECLLNRNGFKMWPLYLSCRASLPIIVSQV